MIELNERVACNRRRAPYSASVSHAILAARPAALRRLIDRRIALAIWQRSLPADIETELAGLVLNDIDDILLTSDIAALDIALATAMKDANYPALCALQRDIVMLACELAAVTDDRQVRIRLEVVETDACRKFHTDYVKARTLVTYRGRGTQWIEASSADALSLPGGPDVREVETGSVAVFKGRLWQECPTILHRSPPIGNSGEQRLVLAIDPVSAEDGRTIRLQDLAVESGFQDHSRACA